MLLAERYAYYRYAKQNAKQKMLQRKRDAGKDHPHKIQYGTTRSAAVNDLLFKREKAYRRHFEALCADGNADYGNAPEAADQKPAEAADEPAENEPKNVAYQRHDLRSFNLNRFNV